MQNQREQRPRVVRFSGSRGTDARRIFACRAPGVPHGESGGLPPGAAGGQSGEEGRRFWDQQMPSGNASAVSPTFDGGIVDGGGAVPGQIRRSVRTERRVQQDITIRVSRLQVTVPSRFKVPCHVVVGTGYRGRGAQSAQGTQGAQGAQGQGARGQRPGARVRGKAAQQEYKMQNTKYKIV